MMLFLVAKGCKFDSCINKQTSNLTSLVMFSLGNGWVEMVHNNMNTTGTRIFDVKTMRIQLNIYVLCSSSKSSRSSKNSERRITNSNHEDPKCKYKCAGSSTTQIANWLRMVMAGNLVYGNQQNRSEFLGKFRYTVWRWQRHDTTKLTLSASTVKP